MSRIVVSDSTCLIALERIDELGLLPALFEQVFVPPVVAAEFARSLTWLIVMDPSDKTAVADYARVVDAGEAEAIALAEELKCEVILDDLPARRLATRLGLPHLGVLGLFLRAKSNGIVPAVHPLINGLRAKHFFISDALVAEALRLAGE